MKRLLQKKYSQENWLKKNIDKNCLRNIFIHISLPLIKTIDPICSVRGKKKFFHLNVSENVLISKDSPEVMK